MPWCSSFARRSLTVPPMTRPSRTRSSSGSPRGELPETFRLARPGAMVAFGKQDVNSPGYTDAVTAAYAGGFEAVQRLAGGRAAVFHENTIAFAWAGLARDTLSGTHDRFRTIAGIVERALRRLGVDARTGEIPRRVLPRRVQHQRPRGRRSSSGSASA